MISQVSAGSLWEWVFPSRVIGALEDRVAEVVSWFLSNEKDEYPVLETVAPRAFKIYGSLLDFVGLREHHSRMLRGYDREKEVFAKDDGYDKFRKGFNTAEDLPELISIDDIQKKFILSKKRFAIIKKYYEKYNDKSRDLKKREVSLIKFLAHLPRGFEGLNAVSRDYLIDQVLSPLPQEGIFALIKKRALYSLHLIKSIRMVFENLSPFTFFTINTTPKVVAKIFARSVIEQLDKDSSEEVGQIHHYGRRMHCISAEVRKVNNIYEITVANGALNGYGHFGKDENGRYQSINVYQVSDRAKLEKLLIELEDASLSVPDFYRKIEASSSKVAINYHSRGFQTLGNCGARSPQELMLYILHRNGREDLKKELLQQYDPTETFPA